MVYERDMAQPQYFPYLIVGRDYAAGDIPVKELDHSSILFVGNVEDRDHIESIA